MINLTEQAKEYLSSMVDSYQKKYAYLSVNGGGCSGFQYGFTFDEKVQDGDAEIAKCGVKLLVDPMSIQYLRGAEIDYQEGLEGAQFIIKNPNAKTTCGCGSSFST